MSHAFVRACTRGRGSHLVFMVERGNDVQRHILSDCTQLSAEMQGWVDRLSHDQGSSAPPRDLHETINPYHSDSDDESEDYIKDPTTSGRIYLQDAVTVVYRIAAGLDNVGDEQTDPPLFEYEESLKTLGESPTYVCTVIFPPGSPISKVSGSSCPSTSQARRDACYQACVQFFNRDLLDYRLFPLSPNITSPRDSEKASRGQKEPCLGPQTARMSPLPSSNFEVKTLGTHCYPRKKPDFWDLSEKTTCDRLYPTVISTTFSNDSAQPYAPLLLLTGQPLPPLPSFKLFFSSIPADIHLTQGASFEVDKDRLDDLHLYTIRVCRAITNKAFVCPIGKMQYFLAPLAPTWKTPTESLSKKWKHPNVVKHIPWDQVTIAANDWAVPLASHNLRTVQKDVEDAVIQDRWVEFTRRYDVVRMRPDMTPLSKPEDSPVYCLTVLHLPAATDALHPPARIKLRQLGGVLQSPTERVRGLTEI